MDDRFIKYTKLSLIIFLLFLAIPVGFSLVFGIFYGLSAVISSKPVDLIFEIFVISFPPLIFCTAYSIFFVRTKSHPSTFVKYFSWCLFAVGILISLYFLINDLSTYFKVHYHDITNYSVFAQWYLAGNIAAIFLIGVMQAFTTKKEKDWMEKAKDRATASN